MPPRRVGGRPLHPIYAQIDGGLVRYVGPVCGPERDTLLGSPDAYERLYAGMVGE